MLRRKAAQHDMKKAGASTQVEELLLPVFNLKK
jgi:hypothetical protein